MDDTAATDAANPSRSKCLRKGRDELNLATMPLSVLTHQQPTDTERKQKHYSRSFAFTVFDDQADKWRPAKVTLESNPRVGLPTPADESLFLAFFNLAFDAGLTVGDRLEFVPNQLFKLLGLKSATAKNYDRLSNQLRRLTAVKVICEYAWYDVEGHSYTSEKIIGLLADSQLHRPRRSPDRRLPKPEKADVSGKNLTSYVVFDPEIYRQLISGTLKPLDLAFYFSLKLPTARRMYRTLDRYFYRRTNYSSDLRNFAHGNLGMSDQLNTGQIKRNLEPAIHELVMRDFIQPADPSDRYTKVKKGIWRINFEKTPRHKTTNTSKSVGDTADPLATELVDRGITKSVATTLVKQFPADRITKHIEVFDWYNAKRGEQKKPGWLRTAIQDDYATPDAYATKADREAKAKAKQQQHQALTQKAKAEKERSDREAKERQQLKTTWQPVWDKLSADDRGLIEHHVLTTKYPTVTDRRSQKQISSSHIFLLDCLRYLAEHSPAIVADK